MPLLDGDDPVALHDAARHLADGELLAFPTETVYGLGARAGDGAAGPTTTTRLPTSSPPRVGRPTIR